MLDILVFNLKLIFGFYISVFYYIISYILPKKVQLGSFMFYYGII